MNLLHVWQFTLVLSLLSSISPRAAETRHFEAEAAARIGGASEVADTGASGGTTVTLAKPDQAIKYTGLPVASKLAVRYASVAVGTKIFTGCGLAMVFGGISRVGRGGQIAVRAWSVIGFWWKTVELCSKRKARVGTSEPSKTKPGLRVACYS